MKVGDYVRTKNGIIGKIESRNLIGYNDWIIDTLYYKDDEIIDDWTCGVKEYDILKSSPNIIDLISEDDLLKIEYELASGGKQSEVVQVIKNFEGKLFVNLWVGKFFIEELELYNKHIKSIVTKEQFSSMKYEVK